MYSQNFPMISSSTQIFSTPTGISSPIAADRVQFPVKNKSNSPRKWNPNSKGVSASVVARAFGLKSSPVSMAKDAVNISRSVLQTSSELTVRVLKSLLILVLINEAIVLFLLILPSPSQKQRDEKQKPFRKRLVSVLWKRNAAVTAAVEEEVAARRAIAIRRVREEQQPDRKDDESLREFSLFVTSRGQTLFTQSWTPLFKEIRGLVVVLHGLNEHSDRYSKFAKELNANGYKVYAMDWIGHGGSDGLHAYVHSLDEAVMHTKSFIEKVLAENPGVPCFCFGHSTGAAIVLKAVLDPKVEACIAGVVLTSPAVAVQASHPIFAVLAPVFSLLIPRYQFGAAKRRGIPVSRDPDALVAKYSDPLVYTGPIRIRTGYEILRISTYLQKNLRRLKVALLVLHGTADTITDPRGSRKLYEEAASTDKTIRLFEGFLHDLLFEPEPEREIVVKGIIDWLNSRRVV